MCCVELLRIPFGEVTTARAARDIPANVAHVPTHTLSVFGAQRVHQYAMTSSEEESPGLWRLPGPPGETWPPPPVCGTMTSQNVEVARKLMAGSPQPAHELPVHHHLPAQDARATPAPPLVSFWVSAARRRGRLGFFEDSAGWFQKVLSSSQFLPAGRSRVTKRGGGSVATGVSCGKPAAACDLK